MALGQGLRLQTEYLWLFTFALLLTQSLTAGKASAFAGAVSGALAAFLLFVKLSAGMAAAPMILIGAVALVEARTRASLRTLVAVAAGFLAVFVTVLTTHFGSLRTFARWIRLSLELFAGYSASMSLQGSAAELLLGMGVVFCFVGVAGFWLRRRSVSLAVAAAFSLPVFLAYKHGFVRQATHAPLFFSVGLVFLAALVPLADGDRSRGQAAVFFGAALALVGAETGLRRPGGVSSFLAGASGLAGAHRVVALARLPAVRRELAEKSRENLKEERSLPNGSRGCGRRREAST